MNRRFSKPHPSCGTDDLKMYFGNWMTSISLLILFLHREDNVALKKFLWLPCINKTFKLILKKFCLVEQKVPVRQNLDSITNLSDNQNLKNKFLLWRCAGKTRVWRPISDVCTWVLPWHVVCLATAYGHVWSKCPLAEGAQAVWAAGAGRREGWGSETEETSLMQQADASVEGACLWFN